MSNHRREFASDSPKTFVRGLHILPTLQRAGPRGLDIPTLAKLSGVKRTTVYRYLDVLLKMGYASREDTLYRYCTPQLTPIDPAQHLVDRIAQAMRHISEVTGDSSFLVTRQGDDALCLHRELGAYPVQVLAVSIGHLQPMGVGAAGLALLASLPHAQSTAILDHNESRLSRYGGMTRAHLEHLVQATRERGWSVVGNAAVPGVLGVGLAVVHEAYERQFAISVSGLMSRMPVTRQRFIAARMRTELEKALTLE